MLPEEIVKIAINSAESYYSYLDENDNGFQEVEVFDLEYVTSADLILKLRLASKLFNIESIFLKISTKKEIYNETAIKIIEYDEDRNILFVKINEKFRDDFQNLKAQNIKIIIFLHDY